MPETTVNISVNVTNANGDALENATVTLTHGTLEFSGTTGRAGGCTLRDVKTGEYDLECYCEGYSDKTDTFTVTSETTSLNITMALKYNATTPTLDEEEGEF